MFSIGRSIGRQSRVVFRDQPATSSLAERLNRYVENVAEPNERLDVHERHAYRVRVETALNRAE